MAAIPSVVRFRLTPRYPSSSGASSGTRAVRSPASSRANEVRVARSRATRRDSIGTSAAPVTISTSDSSSNALHDQPGAPWLVRMPVTSANAARLTISACQASFRPR